MENEELCIRHLITSAASINESNNSSTLLKTHLLTQCLELANFNYKLPNNIFGNAIRCSNCCVVWKNGMFKSTLKHNKLTKSAKKRFKSIIRDKDSSSTKQQINNAKCALYKNKLIINCFACAKNTEVYIENNKTNKNIINELRAKTISNPKSSANISNEAVSEPSNILKKKTQIPFYESMNSINSKPIESPSIPKPVKNKRLRDKYAGLCKIACTESKSELANRSDNPLHLLLKNNN